MPVSSPTVKYETRDRVAWVTLNRPEAMNALNTEIRNAIGEAFLEATNDDGVLVIIVTGEGGKAFSAGADLAEMNQRNTGRKRTAIELPERDTVDKCPKPVIAAIDGYCLAGGLELALCCDIRIATEKSRFGMPEPRRSILAGYGLHNLSRVIPLGEALWIQLSGSQMTAQRAYDIGLIQALVTDRSALFAEAERMAGEIKLCAPLAVRAIKRIVKVGRNLPVEYSWKLAEPIMAQIDKTEDHLEGPRAFVEKRAPVWKTR
ncbi:MAG: enoyl-CoA hydratase [Dehalococcoidales bacterium]|nr:enoyl-CoA hydratase [Dehalococcoidales bacterium]